MSRAEVVGLARLDAMTLMEKGRDLADSQLALLGRVGADQDLVDVVKRVCCGQSTARSGSCVSGDGLDGLKAVKHLATFERKPAQN
jgi:hypothetical protein